jgi:RNA polymerase sigma-70 factor (ECF subfamily)
MTHIGPESDDGAKSSRSPQEWGEFFDAHHNAVWRYLCRRAGPTVADDLAGETFLRALQSHKAPAPDAERAWLYGIATNLLRERSRKQIRHLRAYGRLAASTPEMPDPDAVADRLDAAAMAPVLTVALANLKPNERDTFLLYALTELDYAGIAVAMGVPIGTVRSRLHRARSRLQQALGTNDIKPAGTSATQARTA